LTNNSMYVIYITPRMFVDTL